uniref:SRC kinase signaling inhibitor 1 n=1 Tax=Sander lucioperca TaxID=283035 RepID=A0A8D0DAY6_SANLU
MSKALPRDNLVQKIICVHFFPSCSSPRLHALSLLWSQEIQQRPYSGSASLADQASRVSFASAENLETMSEPDIPIGFNRMNRLRQSLPLARTSSQAKLRAPGILFLQLGEETRRVHLTHELTSLDTLRALIVHMFPQRLTMAMLRSPNTALLIKDETRNVFYELEDPRDIQDRCVIKIYCKEPIYGTYPGHQHPHLANGDLRASVCVSFYSLILV